MPELPPDPDLFKASRLSYQLFGHHANMPGVRLLGYYILLTCSQLTSPIR